MQLSKSRLRDDGDGQDHDDDEDALGAEVAGREPKIDESEWSWLAERIDQLDVAMAHRQFDDAVACIIESACAPFPIRIPALGSHSLTRRRAFFPPHVPHTVRGFLSKHVAMGTYRPVRLALEQRTNALASRICSDLASPSILSRGLLRQTVKQLLGLGLQDLVRGTLGRHGADADESGADAEWGGVGLGEWGVGRRARCTCPHAATPSWSASGTASTHARPRSCSVAVLDGACHGPWTRPNTQETQV